MKCPECGKEMREGFLFCSKDGAFSFADQVPGVFENAKNAPGFVKITELRASPKVSRAALGITTWPLAPKGTVPHRCLPTGAGATRVRPTASSPFTRESRVTP